MTNKQEWIGKQKFIDISIKAETYHACTILDVVLLRRLPVDAPRFDSKLGEQRGVIGDNNDYDPVVLRAQTNAEMRYRVGARREAHGRAGSVKSDVVALSDFYRYR
jgi:hypothetical protein